MSMLLCTLKSNLETIAKEYLKAHPDSNDGHVNQDKANFLLRAIQKVNDKFVLLALAEELTANISEWNPAVKGSINLIGKGLFLSKPLVGSILKTDLQELLDAAHKSIVKNESEINKYNEIKKVLRDMFKSQLSTGSIITNFEIGENSYNYRYLDNNDKVHRVNLPHEITTNLTSIFSN